MSLESAFFIFPGIQTISQQSLLSRLSRRSTPLKTLAQLLHSANPSISKPLALHSFRLVYYNSSRDAYSSEDMGRGITRVSRSALADRLSSDEARKFLGIPGGGQEAEEDGREGENKDATRTLADFNLVDGDMVECLILDDEQKRSSQARRSGGAAMPPSNHPAMRPDYQGTWGPPRMSGGRRGIAEQRTGAGGGW